MFFIKLYINKILLKRNEINNKMNEYLREFAEEDFLDELSEVKESFDVDFKVEKDFKRKIKNDKKKQKVNNSKNKNIKNEDKE